MNEDDTPAETLNVGLFADAVNRQGHAFQQAVLAQAKALFEAHRSPWLLEATEFPVEVKGQGTRIDFVLREHMGGASGRRPMLIGECKRVNPAYSDWLFLKAPIVRRSHRERFVAEFVQDRLGKRFASGAAVEWFAAEKMFNFAVEVKTNNKGEAAGQKNAIEDAASQVCRGLNGMIEHLHGRAKTPLGRDESYVVVPAIFTTASIYTDAVNLCATDIASGKIDEHRLNPMRVPYVYYQYHLSPGIKHSLPRASFEHLSPVLEADYIRTIPVVSADGIEDFLTTFRISDRDAEEITR